MRASRASIATPHRRLTGEEGVEDVRVRDQGEGEMTVCWEDPGMASVVRDLWEHADLGSSRKRITPPPGHQRVENR